MAIDKMHRATTLEAIIQWLQSNWMTIYSAMLSMLIAYARIVYDGENKKKKWVEALLCGALTMTVKGALDSIAVTLITSGTVSSENIDIFTSLFSGATPFIGAVIGFIGVDKIRALVIKFLNSKAGNCNDYEDR